MPAEFYANGYSQLFDKQGRIAWVDAPMRVALVGSTYRFDPQEHRTLFDLLPWEIVGQNYDRKPLRNKKFTQATWLQGSLATADDITWAKLNSKFPIGGAVVFVEGNGALSSSLVAYFPFNPPMQTHWGDLSLKWGNAVLTFGSSGPPTRQERWAEVQRKTAWDRIMGVDLCGE